MMDEVAEEVIKVRILQNPFDPSSYIEEEIVYDANKNLADYLEGLPSPDAWTVGHRGLAIQPRLWKEFKPEAGEMISLVRAPEGGDSGKQILRIVAMIAIAVAAPYLVAAMGLIGTAAAIATAAITIVGSILVNVLIPPPVPDFSESGFSETDSPSYGIDGPKQTSREGLPIPVVYGEHRVAGNIADIYTQNEGDLQYLYMRTVLNDGQVANVTDIEINDQPIDNFTDVQNRVRLGYEEQSINDWFSDATRLVNRNTILTNSSWLTHTTTGEVDKIRLDLVAPQGIVEFNDKGDKITAYVGIDFQFREVGTTTWNILPLENIVQSIPYTGSEPIGTVGSGGAFGQVLVTANNARVGSTSLTYNQTSGVEYRPVGSTGAWTTLGSQATSADGYYDPTWGATGDVVEPSTTHVYDFNLSDGEYEVQATDGTIEEIRQTYTAGVSRYNMSGSSTSALRRTLQSVTLNRAEYEVRVRRTTAESDNTSKIDAVYLSDIGEIDVSPVNLKGVANLGLRIKLSDQISSRPTLTALVKGCLLKKYDRDGNFLVEEWDNNPAWIVIDMLTNPLRGAGMALSRFDWDSVVEWAEECEEKGYVFNGVFDYESNIWDATQLVLRLGHAQFLRMGTKWAFVVDRASDPVTAFNDSNVFMDTLNTNWLPMSERATEIQLSYADEADSYKRKTIRLVDPLAAQAGEVTRVSSYTEMGITNAEQATAEAEYQLRRNRLLRKTTTFDAPMDSIALLIGDVAELKFKQADFANGEGGKLASGSTASILQLDRDVTIQSGKTYKVLVHQPAVKRYDGDIDSITGDTVAVDAGDLQSVNASSVLEDCDRFIANGVDRHIRSITTVGSTVYFKLDSATGVGSDQFELWQTNVVEEQEVGTSVAGEYSSISVANSFSFTPSQYASWIFGEETLVSEKARLIGIDGDEIHSRTLTFIEYNEDLYLPAGADIPRTEVVPVEAPQHVSDLYVDYNKFPTGDTDVQNLTVTWTKPNTVNYAGADVYTNEDSTGWRLVNTVRDVTQANVPIKDGVNVRIRVVGFDTFGRRAPFAAAPTIRFTADYVYRDLALPTNLSVTETNYDVTGRVKTSWSAPVDEIVTGYRIDVRTLSETDYNAITADPTLGEPQADWTEQEIADWNAAFTISVSVPDTTAEIANLTKGYYQFRVRAERGRSHSNWLTLSYELASPTFVNAVTGLQTVDGGTTFGGNAAEIVWDDIFVQAQALSDDGLPYILKDYEVQILSLTDELLRTEHVQEPRYIYSYDKNVEDTTLALARRSFKVSVKARGRQDQESNAQVITVSNPAPARSGSPVINGQDVTLPVIDDIDSLGYRLWVKSTNDIDTATDTYTDIVGNSFTLPSIPGEVMYFKYAPRDAFDDENLDVSGSFSGTGRAVTYSSITGAPTSLGELDSTANQAIIDLQDTYGDTASAAASAAAAATSESNASASEAAAANAETAAATAASAAATHEAAAAAAETAAETAASNASASEIAAATSASNASASETAAETAATAASGSASAAQAAETAAETAQGIAETAATQAQAADVSATTASELAVEATADNAPSRAANTQYFCNQSGLDLGFGTVNDSDIGPSMLATNPDDGNAGENIFQRRFIPIVAGETWKVQITAKLVAAGTTGGGLAAEDSLWTCIAYYDEDGSYLGDRDILSIGTVAANGSTLTGEYDIAGYTASNGPAGATQVRLGAHCLRDTNAEMAISQIKVWDATSELAAEGSATAAATSETNAGVSATEASTSAAAAETSRVEAATSASNASTSETNAATSETNAAGSAAAAATSETNAANSETAAGNSATAASSSASSASTSATDAATAATSATNSANTAATEASNASTSASEAATSETNAAGSAASAATSATNAANSETAAGNSASAASTSASNASTSATDAQTAATSATSSANTAATEASNAATSATEAATSETNAAGSAAAAATSETNAANSETAAGNSASAASSSASSASTSASNAATSATSATNSANTAATEASNASTSASEAATSETNAAGSAAAAATSETNAANSETAAGNSASAASTSASAASTSASDAETAATSATSSANTAATEASNAATSATQAATSETNAAGSAASAATSETNAANSETAAGNSATAASNSASSASTSATDAATAASSATSSANTAATEASDAAASATQAATSETNAAGSASSASTSETNAANSETAAGNSASAASNSASAASTSASDAATSATAASASATTAATEASNAGVSATNAATSETNAATSETNASASAAEAVTATTASAKAALTIIDANLNDRTAQNGGTGAVEGSADTLLTYAADPDIGECVVVVGNGGGAGETITHRGVAPFIVGRKYELYMEYKVVSADTTIDMYFNIHNLLGDYSGNAAPGNARFLDQVASHSTTGVFTATTVLECGVDGNDDGTDGTKFWRFGFNTMRGITGNEIRVGRFRVTDVTDREEVSASATAAATSESNASASETAAGNSATAAAADAVTASTKADNASTSAAAAATSESNASASETAAGNSASAAASSAVAASTSESNAANSASAAATSESNASASETTAGQSATAADNSATNAATSASNASASEGSAATSASNAATSETNASSSAAAASSSETAAEATYDATTDTYSQTLPLQPKDLTGIGWTYSSAYGTTTNHPPVIEDATHGIGLHWPSGNSSNVYTSYGFLIDPLRTYKCELKQIQLTDPTSGTTRFIYGFSVHDASGSYIGVYGWANHQNVDNSDGLVHLSQTATGADIIATYPTAKYVRARTQPNRLTSGGAASDGTVLATAFGISDVTAEEATNASATAANTSATNAAASATASANSAAASETSATNAASSESAAGVSETNAATAATQAATSESAAQTHASAAQTSATNAASSESAAGISETNSANSATQAATSESEAQTYATAAQSSQIAAATSETNAGVSETNAATSATDAAGSASAAQSAKEVVASLTGGEGFGINPKFVNWDVSNSEPTGWLFWTGDGTLSRESTKRRYAATDTVRINVTASESHGIRCDNYALQNGGYGVIGEPAFASKVVVTTEVYLVSGSTDGAGILIQFRDGTTGHGGSSGSIIATEKIELSDFTVPTGKWVKVSTLIDMPSGATGYTMYLMANYNSFTSSQSAKDIIFASGDIRNATPEEIEASRVSTIEGSISTLETAIADETAARASAISTVQSEVNGLSASVTTNASTIADIDGQLQASYGIAVDGSGNASIVLLSDGSTLGSAIILTADEITLDGDVIVTGTITTDRLAAGAVTNTEVDEPADSDVDEDWDTLATISFLSVGIGVELRASVQLYAGNFPGGGIGGIGYVRLRRDGTTTLREKQATFNMVNTSTDPLITYYEGEVDFALDKNDLPSAGTHTYTLEAKMPGNTGATHTSTAKEIYLSAREFKR